MNSNPMITIYIRIALFFTKKKYQIFRLFNVKIGKYNTSREINRIGFIDQDGLIHVPEVYSHLFNSNDLYSGGEFLQRKRFYIDVLLENGLILLEKNFQANSFAFYNELTILNKLKSFGFVPKIYFVDYKNSAITLNYIDGFVLRERIAKFNCGIRDIDRKMYVINKAYLDPVIVVKDIVSKKLLDNMIEQINKIHQMKILIRDIKYGNIIIKDEESFLIDFHDAIYFKYTPKIIFDTIKNSDLLILQNIFRYIN